MEHPRRRTLLWLIGLRAVVSTVLLGGAIVAQVRAQGSLPIDPFFFLIAFTYAVTVVYALTLRWAERIQWLVDIQLAVDALIVSAFIFFTGGITSVFPTLYVLPIVAASTVGFRRSGVMVATLSAAMYVGLVLVQYTIASETHRMSWLVVEAAMLPPRAVVQYRVALNLFGFFAVAWLSGSLAEVVRATRIRLEEASTEIADLQALNQHVIDSLPSGLLTTDHARCVLTFNHAAEAITGLSASAVIGRPVVEALQLTSEIVEALDQGLNRRGARRLEFKFRRPDDRRYIDIGLGASHLETPRGRAGILITFQDVTDLNKLERDARLQQRLAAVGEMAAGIAHEIRNPLASMSGSIQILRQELPLSAEQEQLMDIVLRESDRLNSTIRSFLAYARPQRFAIARLDLRRALNDTALLLRNSADVLEGHSVQVDLPASELWYEADEGQIKQIVWNLATNGLRAMPEGGRLRLTGALDPSSDELVLSVQDEGIGLMPEDIDGLFQPFHGSFAKGSGLGLAIVHRIVSDYHGQIQVASQPGAGTTVSVRFPARTAVTA
jgi:two-component system sensor histidine kinase PilS (NtrC family)